jgi:HK97 gp10 family phage protein
VKVKIEGLAELDAALSQLKKSTAKSVLRRVGIKALAPVQAAAQNLAPVRAPSAPEKYYKKGENTFIRPRGTTKKYLFVSTRLNKSQARKARKLGKSEVEVYMGTRVSSSRLVEFGTSDTPAQPFMRPAWDAEKAGVLDTVATELGAEIDKAAARAAKRASRAR